MKEPDTTLGYKIVKIQTTKFEFKEINEDEIQVIFFDNKSLRVDMSVQIEVSKENSTVTFHIETTVVKINTEDSLIKHTGITRFKTAGMEAYFNQDDNSYDFPPEFLVQLHTLAHSHARALLAVELSSTVYRDQFYLPIIDPRTILGLE